VASPRVCSDRETEGSREAGHAVEGRARDDKEEMALGEGACRESIVMCSCAQLSERPCGIDGIEVEIEIL
jgi:hypothetical protein